jgi:deoxyribodipyrimidine photolyase-related protein
MDGPDPLGETWNHDHANREPPPRGAVTLEVPPPWQPPEDAIDAEVRADLDRMELPTVGRDGPRWFAVTAAEGRRALQHFVEHRLPHFGPHEDAMLTADWAMAHSLLSVPLNLGVLHPLDVVHAAEEAHRAGLVSIASAEGFIRQVLGWREYVWQLYWRFGRTYRRRNALHARTPLPDWWQSLDAAAVTARCLSSALEGVRDRGWTHHIQRLMVLGNHALQRGYQPAELSDWFREAFVDGFEWVMPPNVIGMSQHADNGMMATKPYSAGGAYINRMSDHCHDCPFDPRKRLGEDACPFTAGYWAWTHRHRELLAANHRTARAVASMERLTDLDAVLEQESARELF